MCLQQQKGEGSALQMLLLCTAPSYGCHTSVAIFEKDSLQLRYSLYMSAYFINNCQILLLLFISFVYKNILRSWLAGYDSHISH